MPPLGRSCIRLGRSAGAGVGPLLLHVSIFNTLDFCLPPLSMISHTALVLLGGGVVGLFFYSLGKDGLVDLVFLFCFI
jgi:hypothetical protein